MTDPTQTSIDEYAAASGPLPRTASDRLLFAVALVAALGLLLAIAWPMLHGLLYTYDDLAKQYIPWRSYYAKCLAEGLDFNWFPNMYCGYYLQGDGQVGMYHPLHRLLYGSLDFTTAFNAELFLSYPVMLAGMFLFLRRRGLARDAAMFGALVFTFSGFNLLHLVHMQGIAIIAHLPWILVAIDVSLLSRSRIKAAAANLAAAFLVASQVLLGHLQYTWLSGAIAALYTLYLVRERRSIMRLVPLAAAVLCGALIGGVQLAPTYGEVHASGRLGVEMFDPFKLSLRPLNLVQLVAPFLFEGRVHSGEAMPHTHEYGLYGGAAVLLMCVLAAAGAVKLGDKRRLATAAAILVALGLVLALGRYGGVYELVAKLPFIGWFRAPARYIVLVHFGLAVGAAVFFEAARSAAHSALTRRARVILIAVPSAAVVAAVLGGLPWGGAAPKWALLAPFADRSTGALLAGPALLATAAVLVFAALRGSRLALGAIIVLTAAEMGVYGLSYVYSSPPATFASMLEAARLPQAPSFFRVEEIPSVDIKPAMAGYKQVTGYAGLPPAKALDYTKKQSLRLASAAYAMMAKKQSGAAAGTPAWLFLPVDNPMPRARLVSNAVVCDAPASRIGEIDIAATALVGEDLALEPGAPGTAAVTRDLPGDIAVTADAPTRQLLILSESYHGGWRASIDGAAARPVPVYGDFLGVVVEKGRHEARFRFAPESLRVGRLMTVAGLALALALFAAALLAPGRGAKGGAR